jgi:hypothetical protein
MLVNFNYKYILSIPLQKNTMAGSHRLSETAPITALLFLKGAMYNSGKTRPT